MKGYYRIKILQDHSVSAETYFKTQGIWQNPMAILQILEFPDPRLRKIAAEVKTIDDKVVTMADDMLETMYAAPGIGLAATQVNWHQRVIVVDVSEDRNSPHILINPELTHFEGEIETAEGCLSVPGFYEPVTRYEQIQVKALNTDGNPFTLEAEGLLAVCIQHEMDHLLGKLFVDYLSSAKSQQIRRKLLKLQKQRA